LAAIGAGGVVSGANPASTVEELVNHLTITNTKFIITQEENLAKITVAARACGIPDRCIFVLGLTDELQHDPTPYQSWKVLLRFGEEDWIRLEDEKEQESTIAALSSTSGTTGLPKAAKISHRYLVTQSTMIQEKKRGSPHKACQILPHLSRSITDMSQITQLVFLPLFHAFAAQLGLVLPLRHGMPTYFMPKFELVPDFVEVVRKFQITDIAVVPRIVTMLLRSDCLRKSELYSLRYVLCAGAPMVAAIQDKLYQAIHPEGVVAQVWGTTETGWVTAFGSAEKDSSGSVGRCLRGVDVKVVDELGQVVGNGEHGEACVHTPSLFSGYLEPSTANGTDIDDDGYYHTGDRAYILGDRVFINGRIKDTFKVNGWQVSPTEIEKVLSQHPDIIDAAVIGKERVDEGGLKATFPQAFVLRRTLSGEDEPTIIEEDVKSFVAGKLVSYKHLAGGVVFVDDIPRTPTGKIKRHELEERSLRDQSDTIDETVTRTEAVPPELSEKLQRLPLA
jgi:acyl-CoA synthetase (AMP-forming)/AMP-acid ligase II